MRVVITGATGLIGQKVIDALLQRGDSVVALSRSKSSAQQRLRSEVEVYEWGQPTSTPAPVAALHGADAVIHLLGEPVAQRWTGLVAILYIGQHVYRQRFSGVSLPEHPGAAFAKVQQELANPWMLAVYIIAMIAICWHFSYGIWLFAAKWGITPGATARKRFGYVCAAFGVVILFIGLASIWAFIEPKYQNAPQDVTPVVSTLASPASIELATMLPS